MSIVTLSTDIQNSGDTVPEWIQLLPNEQEFSAVDGREFVIRDTAEIIALSTRTNVDINIDYEHSIQDKSKEIKPAAGWIKELEIKNDAIWGRVEWTPKAKKMIANKEYRYLSPLLSTIPSIDGKHIINKIVNVALTNFPALEMSSFCRNENTDLDVNKLHNLEAMSQISKLMNIESCSPSDILAALKQKQNEQEIQACKSDVDQVFNQYVYPLSVKDEFTTIRQTLGREKFQALMQKLSCSGFGNVQILNVQTTALKARGVNFDAKPNNYGLSEQELAVCKETNIKPEDYIKVKESNNGC